MLTFRLYCHFPGRFPQLPPNPYTCTASLFSCSPHFSMCKTKRKDVIVPKSSVRRSRPNKFSGSTPEQSRSTESTIDSSYRDSEASTSSKISLASLKESLPENPHIFSFAEICKATKNFHAKPLGRSTAWRCTISGKDSLIIKRSYHAVDNFPQRLKAICTIYHGALVKLLGASISGEHIYLVYDYIHGANLENCLRNPKNPNFTVLSTWASRMQVATDVAQGLEYIHHYTGDALIHNHIKSASVIVTEPSFNAQIALFGTAELSGELLSAKPNPQIPSSSLNSEIVEEESSTRFNRSRSLPKINGTQGYMAPEYISAGIVSQKSDVFAFGVVLLEILSGEEPVKYTFDDRERGEYKRVSLIERANKVLDSPGSGGLRQWIDCRLRDSYPVEIAERALRLALACVDVDPNLRPDMRNVAGKLSKFYLDSKTWSEKMQIPAAFTVTLGPR